MCFPSRKSDVMSTVRYEMRILGIVQDISIYVRDQQTFFF